MFVRIWLFPSAEEKFAFPLHLAIRTFPQVFIRASSVCMRKKKSKEPADVVSSNNCVGLEQCAIPDADLHPPDPPANRSLDPTRDERLHLEVWNKLVKKIETEKQLWVTYGELLPTSA